MKITSVFLRDSITWPGTRFSGAVSFDEGKPGLLSMVWNETDSGVYITVSTVDGRGARTFIPSSNIKNVNYAIINGE